MRAALDHRKQPRHPASSTSGGDELQRAGARGRRRARGGRWIEIRILPWAFTPAAICTLLVMPTGKRGSDMCEAQRWRSGPEKKHSRKRPVVWSRRVEEPTPTQLGSASVKRAIDVSHNRVGDGRSIVQKAEGRGGLVVPPGDGLGVLLDQGWQSPARSCTAG